MKSLLREDGRKAFGGDPQGYLDGRPGYPGEMFRVLREDCGLCGGAEVFEIGPGAGQLTGDLLREDIRRVVAVEPDGRLAEFLRGRFGEDRRLEVRVGAFEEVELEEQAYDVGLAGTSFHWLEAHEALPKVRRALKPGGWWVACWNVFMDPKKKDDFLRATAHLFAELPMTPSQVSERKLPFALDVEARLSELQRAGFVHMTHEFLRREVVMNTEETLSLYRTFSQIATMPEEGRTKVLGDLAEIMERDFGGRVRRTIMTAVYYAQKPAR